MIQHSFSPCGRTVALGLVLCAVSCGGGGGGGGRGSSGGTAPRVSVADASAVEGHAGTTKLRFDVTLSAPASREVTVAYATAEGSAREGSDYVAKSGVLRIPAGTTDARITVEVMGDGKGEDDETFHLTLSKPSGATLGAGAATGTVTNDDAPAKPAVSVVDGGVKALGFSWKPVPGAAGYRLLEDPDGASGFAAVGPDLMLPATSTEHAVAVHLTDWLNTRYRLEAFNAFGSTRSPALGVANQDGKATGFVKASREDPGDLFGHAVALSADGTTLAVGAFGEDSVSQGVDGDDGDNGSRQTGAVYVFTRSGGAWQQQAYLKAANAGRGDRFGTAVVLSGTGDTLVVAARLEGSSSTGANGNDADNASPQSGAVYVFQRSGKSWAQVAYLKASNTGTKDQFGEALALSRDGLTLAVGARREDSAATGVDGFQLDDSAPEAGAVYVFVRSGNSWIQQSYLKASNTDAGDGFGRSLALSADGSRLAVGADQESSASVGVGGDETDDSATRAGAVYVFTRNGAVWSQEAYVKAFDTAEADRLGYSVALSADGNLLAAGAFWEDSGSTGVDGDPFNEDMLQSGAVYVFERVAGHWSQQAYVKASNTEMADQFGYAVALSADGSLLAVGARREDGASAGVGRDDSSNSVLDSGAVYVFRRSAGQWQQAAYVKAPNPGTDDRFGAALALSGDGDTLAVGAPREDSAASGIDGGANESAADSGAVYLF